jgi:cob(I)alamin adenosyltransferase
MLEQAIDKMQAELPELKHFILPGGNEAIASAHVVRTVCRRAERRCVALAYESEVEAIIILYLNRLSDYFFVLARWIGYKSGIEEIKWMPRENS